MRPIQPVRKPKRAPSPSRTKVYAEPLEGSSRENSLYWFATSSATRKPTR